MSIIPMPFRLNSNVADWARETQDPWLEEFVLDHLEDGSAWGHFVAVGVLYRHAPLGSERGRRRLEALREGRFDADLERELTWARSLDSDPLEQLECHALAMVTRLSETLEDLLEVPDYEDEGWRAELLATLAEREELEAARRLFRATSKHGLRLEAVLKVFDPEAENTLRALAFTAWAPPLEEDSLLGRGRSFDPDAWWVSPWASAEACIG